MPHSTKKSNPAFTIPPALSAFLGALFSDHSHSHSPAAMDHTLTSARGLWALKLSLSILAVTALFQLVVFAFSRSTALLADTIHNFSDALTAIPLGIAFLLSRWARNRRYTYGYGRAEDIAGLVIVLMVAFSGIEAIRQSVLRFLNPEPIEQIGWVAAAGAIGFLGNEFVAALRIRVGKEIGSAALVADGYHARTDGFTSLGVLAGAIGVHFGFPILDPIIGMAIGIVILGIVWESARDMWQRIMDAVDPQIMDIFCDAAASVDGVMGVQDAAVRWVGHRMRGELRLTVDCSLSLVQASGIAEAVRAAVSRELPALVAVAVSLDPCACGRPLPHEPALA